MSGSVAMGVSYNNMLNSGNSWNNNKEKINLRIIQPKRITHQLKKIMLKIRQIKEIKFLEIWNLIKEKDIMCWELMKIRN